MQSPESLDQPVPAESRKRRWRYLISMALPFLWFVYCSIAYWKSEEFRGLGWQVMLFLFLLLEAPIVLIALRAHNRWFHPERLPARWPANYPWQSRLDLLSSLLYLGMLGYWFTVIFIGHQHERLRAVAEGFFISAYLLGVVLDRYVKDRAYLEPDTWPEPTGGWSGMIGRLHSDHWGGRGPISKNP